MQYKNVELVNHNSSYRANIEIVNKKIKSITKIPSTGKPSKYMIPTFFDTHTHGGYGLDFNDFVKTVSPQKIKKYLKGIYSEGVTTVSATTVTSTKSELISLAKNMKTCLGKNKAISTWYIEGPFISRSKKGAHNPEKIIPAETKIIDDLNKIFSIKKIIALAPEVSNNDKLVKPLAEKNIVAIGHSDATADQTLAAMVNGATRIIHLYNQVSKYEHRTPGIVNAAFLKINLMCELISDGFHVHPVTLKNTYDIVGPERIMIVSDSLSCKGLKNGEYNLGGLRTTKTNDAVFLHGTDIIAGSIKPYDEQVRLFLNSTHCSMQDIVKMTSYNQWKSIGEESKAILETNSSATFLIVDNNINIVKTVVDGKVVYKK